MQSGFSILVMSIFWMSVANAETASERVDVTPEAVCSSISSHKYQEQCRDVIKNGYFDSKATQLCNQQSDDYKRKACLEAVRGKDYTTTQLTNCSNGKSSRFLMCLKLNGELRKVKAPSEEALTPVEN